MSGTSPTAAYVDATGIHAPTFTDIRTYLVNQFKLIYGDDIVTDPSTQDGQLIGVFALALADVNAACIDVYNNYGPGTSQGVGLSNQVKINGLAREVASYSMVQLRIVGVGGTVILNGQATDTASNNLWNLPPSVIIPPVGEIFVTATAAQLGAITALPNTINRIATVTLGWQTVDNLFAANPGAPVETDPDLRVRQAQSTANPSRTVLEGITGSLLALPGVSHVAPYENDTNVTDANGLPPHSIAMVVQGGDSTVICKTILLRKTPGCFTYGTTREVVDDVYGLPHDIGFFIPAAVPIGVQITMIVKPGYTTQIGWAIQKSISDYINALGSGGDVIYSKLWLPANLCDAQGAPVGIYAGDTFDITSLAINSTRPPAPPTGFGAANIPIGIAEIATCTPASVVLTI